MRIIDIISKKRDGLPVSANEIEFLVKGYVSGDIPDYQMSAFLMAAYVRGLNADETADLTQAMIKSGDTIDLSEIEGVKVDKHSTGGVGDKVTLVLGPMLAAAGLKFAKMSGRGLGHTGGTLDKLESIPGFNVHLTREQFIKQIKEIGIAIMGQTKEICLADKKIYALRDVTGTVTSSPLIASSIMSKKIAGGADAIVFDVKAGSGAFMKTVEEARMLAVELTSIGKHFGKKVVAVISNMDNPLGVAVGNSLEVKEAINALRGFGSADFLELCFTLGSQLMVKAGVSPEIEDAIKKLNGVLESGQALDKFKQLVEAQGGDVSTIDDPRVLLPHATYVEDVAAPFEGYIRKVNAMDIAMATRYLGAGRAKIDDGIDHAAGIVIMRRVGDFVHAGDILAEIHSNDAHAIASVRGLVDDAFEISTGPHEAKPLIYDIID